MEADLRDALTAWQGGELPPGRSDELLARLRDDADFRRAFAEKVWTLSLTRIAQAPAPRWLTLYEELGLSSTTLDATDEITAADEALMAQIRREPAPFVAAGWRRAAYGWMAAAAALALTVWGILSWRPGAGPQPAAAITAPAPLAVVVQTDHAVWERAKGTEIAVGSPLQAGPLRLVSGRASVMFTSGALLDFEGPADLELVAVDRVLCRGGRLHTRVPHDASGFCVETPRGTVTDLGTELGISVSKDGQTHVAVFEGEAEVSLQIPGQEGIRTALLKERQTAALVPETGEIRTETSEGFLNAADLHFAPLALPPRYAETIAAAKPQQYWRLDRVANGLVPNEVPGAAPLRLAGGAAILPDESGRATASFPGKTNRGALYLDGSWTKPARGQAIELWFATNSTEQMAIIALTAAGAPGNHLALLELGSRRPGRATEPGVVRYLLRWPVGARGGMNIFSAPRAFPYQWHHLVAQQADGELELFIDGERAGTALADKFPPEVACALQFGCLEFHPGGDPAKLERPFSGRMAEIAIYDRVLTAEEIRQHAGMLRGK